MKRHAAHIAVLLINLVLICLLGACSDTTSPAPGEGQESMTMAIDFQPLVSTGAVVSRVQVIIEKGDFLREMDLIIDGTTASGVFENLVPGTYDITVNIYDTDTLIATGQGQGTVVAGQTSTAVILMDLESGDLEVVVDWGSGEDFEEVARIPVPYPSPRPIVGSPDGSKIYVGCYNGNAGVVSVIDAETQIVDSTINLSYSPLDLAITSDGAWLYVTNTVNGYYTTKVDLAAGTVAANIRGGTDPSGIAITPDGALVCIANHWTSSLHLVDVETDERVASIGGISNGGNSVAITPDGKFAYVTARFGGPGPGTGLYKVSLEARAVVAVVAVDGEGLAITPDGSEVWVAGSTTDSVFVVSVDDDEVISTIAVGEWPFGIEISPCGSYAFVTARADGTLTKIDTTTRQSVGELETGTWPSYLHLSPDGSRAYVANHRSQSVSVIATGI